MRKQFVTTVTEMLRQNERYVLLLGDIGVHGFHDAFLEFPRRVYNIGILEQSTIGMAAGLAMAGFVPIVHTIAPFLVERSFEQLKIDFGYQCLKGIFVSVGASYDYASLGCTHHCPADVSLIENIPGFSVGVPYNTTDLDAMLKSAYKFAPVYIRMSEHKARFRPEAIKVDPNVKVIVVAIGPSIDMSIDATTDLPVFHAFTSKVRPFSHEMLSEPVKQGAKHIVVVEPYYSSHLADSIRVYFEGKVTVSNFSLPRQFFHGYGHKEDHDAANGFTADKLREHITKCL